MHYTLQYETIVDTSPVVVSDIPMLVGLIGEDALHFLLRSNCSVHFDTHSNILVSNVQTHPLNNSRAMPMHPRMFQFMWMWMTEEILDGR